VYRKDSSVDF